MDKRWCHMCVKDSDSHNIDWYYSVDTDEISLCNNCHRLLNQELEGALERMS
jgi:hypothetical protein